MSKMIDILIGMGLSLLLIGITVYVVYVIATEFIGVTL